MISVDSLNQSRATGNLFSLIIKSSATTTATATATDAIVGMNADDKMAQSRTEDPRNGSHLLNRIAQTAPATQRASARDSVYVNTHMFSPPASQDNADDDMTRPQRKMSRIVSTAEDVRNASISDMRNNNLNTSTFTASDYDNIHTKCTPRINTSFTMPHQIPGMSSKIFSQTENECVSSENDSYQQNRSQPPPYSISLPTYIDVDNTGTNDCPRAHTLAASSVANNYKHALVLKVSEAALPTQSFIVSNYINDSVRQDGIRSSSQNRHVNNLNVTNQKKATTVSNRFTPGNVFKVSDKSSKSISFSSSKSQPSSRIVQATSFSPSVSTADLMDTSESSETELVISSKPSAHNAQEGHRSEQTTPQRTSLVNLNTSHYLGAPTSAFHTSQGYANQRTMDNNRGFRVGLSNATKVHHLFTSTGSLHNGGLNTTPHPPSNILYSPKPSTPRKAPHLSSASASSTAVLLQSAEEEDTAGQTTSRTENSNCDQSDMLSASEASPTASAKGESSPAGIFALDSGRQLRARNKSRKFLPEKTRHKRQTLQDMTRPLKLWLVKHRENPYPSKQEKIELVKTSHMSMIQVSNWFANARRRLKNTVRGDNVSWAKRIKVYNKFAEGNAELLSIPSSDEDWDSEQDTDMESQDNLDSQDNSIQSEPVSSGSTFVEPGLTSSVSDTAITALRSPLSAQRPGAPASRCTPPMDDHQCIGQKFKHSILQRYLQQAIMPVDDVMASSQSRHRHLSSSTGSHDFEYLSTSSVSSPSHEAHQDSLDEFTEDMETIAIKLRPSETPNVNNNDELYWKEISAALALTSLARCHVTK